jgi:adenine/guanine phosphoribosyltransferase-like PRPP-binding protein
MTRILNREIREIREKAFLDKMNKIGGIEASAFAVAATAR